MEMERLITSFVVNDNTRVVVACVHATKSDRDKGRQAEVYAYANADSKDMTEQNLLELVLLRFSLRNILQTKMLASTTHGQRKEEEMSMIRNGRVQFVRRDQSKQ